MFNLAIGLGISIIFISFALEFMDSTIGMGYGTTLTPVLLLMGFAPLQIVPVILLSEFITGLLAGLVHHLMGNADFSIEKKGNDGKMNGAKVSKDLKAVLIIGLCSCLGAALGALIALNLPSLYLKLYIGVLVTALGVYILLTRNKQFSFSWKKLISIGLVASFNKAISGGGFGPLVTGGQVLSGVKVKNAIAITSLAEAAACVAGIVIYFISKQEIDWTLLPYLLIGGVLSVPISGFAVKKIKTKNIVLIVSIAITALGLFTLIKLIL